MPETISIKSNTNVELSRTMRSIIENVIESMPAEDAFDENKLLLAITDYFMNKYPGDKLEYQLRRMKMETTSQIKQAITIYMTRYKDTK